MKECIDCEYCGIEDLYYELICYKKNKDLCPTITKTIIENGQEVIDEIIYPACKHFKKREM